MRAPNPPTTPALALQQFCRKQTALVADGLRRRAHAHRGVHEARKSIRRLRSILALGAPCFGAAGEKIDRALQRLGRSLSKLRDAHVAVELAQAQAEEAASGVERVIWNRIVRQLTAAQKRVLHREHGRDRGFEKRLARVAKIAEAIELLPWQQLRNAVLTARLAHSRRRVDRAARRVNTAANLEHAHALRKRLRRHRMQVGALAMLLDPDAAPPDFRNAVLNYAQSREAIARRSDELGALLDARLLHLAVRRLPRSAARTAALAQLKHARIFSVAETLERSS